MLGSSSVATQWAASQEGIKLYFSGAVQLVDTSVSHLIFL
jgi:hypothetical protein